MIWSLILAEGGIFLKGQMNNKTLNSVKFHFFVKLMDHFKSFEKINALNFKSPVRIHLFELAKEFLNLAIHISPNWEKKT